MKHTNVYRVIDFHAHVENRRVYFFKTQKLALACAKYIRDTREMLGRNPHIKYHKLLKTYVVYSER